ncbi:Elongator subunit elp2 [Podochytrium sp. JEL0797]|nr:Elongator subunit elp2 [Podochytrium sp. JEL0797]
MFTSSSCNRNALATATSPTHTAFASHFAVGIVSLEDKRVVSLLQGHAKEVTCVRFLANNALLSASADASLKVWTQNESTKKWKCTASLNQHTAPINAIAVLPLSETSHLIVSAASDATARVSILHNFDTFETVQTIATGNRYALAANLAFLPNSTAPMLFLGGCDHTLSVYLRGDDGQFTKTLSLHGHTDWIRDIDVVPFTSAGNANVPGFSDGDLMIATASQDKYIRLWKVCETSTRAEESVAPVAVDSSAVGASNSEFDDAIEMLEALVGEEGEGGRQLSTKAHLIEVSVGSVKRKYTIMFDALLIGHEDWVHSVSWSPAVSIDGVRTQRLELVSASADKSVTVWRPDVGHVWSPDVRLGEVGGTSFGFYGARFVSSSSSILAHGYHGAIQYWERKSDVEGREVWEAVVGLSGHYGVVKDIAWNANGDFLVSSSLDQTSRLWGLWAHDPTSKTPTYHELARPQIHGYDLHCLAMLSPYSFISGADEKVLRVFSASQTFLTSLHHISNVSEPETVSSTLPVGAAVPALGLSNKAILSNSSTLDTNAQLTFEAQAPEIIHAPPLEQYLMQHTLWPEVQKLYGHGYEIMALTASKDGKFVASSSKAAVAEHAVIRVWSTETWKEVQKPLVAHSLTVTGLKFSWGGEWLVSCGRDRMWSLFGRKNGEEEFLPVVKNVAHGRIIWGVGWSWDDKYFATGSRDKTVKVWCLDRVVASRECEVSIQGESSVTALAFTPWDQLGGKGYLLAVGHENGRVLFYEVRVVDGKVAVEESKEVKIDAEDCPGLTVTRVAWRPRVEGKEELVLAVSSEDYSVRIYNL